MTEKDTNIMNISNEQITPEKNIKFSSDENSYGKFHAIAIALIVLIFLLKLSSSSIPMKPNHERLSTKTNQTTNTSNIVIASQ